MVGLRVEALDATPNALGAVSGSGNGILREVAAREVLLDGEAWPYEVSSLGPIRNARTRRILRAAPNTQGYFTVCLYDGRGARKTQTVHRLVCRAFHGEPPSARHHAHHVNANKLDNRAHNLAWVTPRQNSQAAVKDGLIAAKGEANNRAKLTAADVVMIRERAASGTPRAEIAREFGIAGPTVSLIVSGKRWGHVPQTEALPVAA